MRRIKPFRQHPVPSLRTVWCCRDAQLQGTKLPHCWYVDRGVIYKWYYCEEHAHETTDTTFKTKNQLLASILTERLLNEKTDEPPF